jgi:type IX secretion system PorP/SprF family membrane protein
MRAWVLYLFIFIFLVLNRNILAQADISMSAHWYNRANYNPASIARTDYLYLFTNIKQQWIGIDGAPQSYNIQASEYIHKLRSAFGFSFVGDKIGAAQAYNPMVSYAYRITNKQYWSLSIGLSAGLFTRIINGSMFEADVATDPSIPYSTNKTTSPDANLGMEFQDAHFVFGASSTHLFCIFKSNYTYLNTNHRYGYLIYKNSNPKLFNYNAGLQIINRKNLTVLEGNFGIRFKRQTGLLRGANEIWDIGLSYRTTKQMAILLGFNIYPDVKIGYSFNKTYSMELNKNNTHEIMVEWRVLKRSASTKYKCGSSRYWYQ